MSNTNGKAPVVIGEHIIEVISDSVMLTYLVRLRVASQGRNAGDARACAGVSPGARMLPGRGVPRRTKPLRSARHCGQDIGEEATEFADEHGEALLEMLGAAVKEFAGSLTSSYGSATVQIEPAVETPSGQGDVVSLLASDGAEGRSSVRLHLGRPGGVTAGDSGNTGSVRAKLARACTGTCDRTKFDPCSRC